MSLLDKLKAGLDQVLGEGQEFFAKVTSKGQFERIVQTCYLIGMADGSFDAEEKSALAKFIHKKMPQFSLSDVIDCIKKTDEIVSFDSDMGQLEIIGNVTKARGEDAEAIVRTAILIGKSDGDFDDDEKALVIQLAKGMEVDPSKYGIE